ncbi:hypothetical protein [Campylobacter mucosalis]|uniref:Cytolethal distending toxin, subunit CdtA n=1 Tax=Campylobacter mucosalis CCUG 21559 TaxID=1032067 RepID=A0A6G5QIH5_9BACT|nr:hypothetical protein [Campylobacter mucosalis]QCD45513.1 cytolethal distending toxin, subunit CdtA [Campylobacter mucosalis CCUG 21559]
MKNNMINKKTLSLLFAIFVALSISGCSTKEAELLTAKGGFLTTNLSFGTSSNNTLLAPNESKAPDRIPTPVNPVDNSPKQPSIPSDPFTLVLSLRSLDTGMPLIVNFAQRGENLNWNIREVKAFVPSMISNIKKVDHFRYLNFEYIQFVNASNIDTCLAIQESGFFGLKSCADDLERGKFETVFQLIPTTTDAVQIRSLVLGGNECISTFENPELFPWQLIGIDKCQLRQGFNIGLPKLWAIMPENRPAKILTPIGAK